MRQSLSRALTAALLALPAAAVAQQAAQPPTQGGAQQAGVQLDGFRNADPNAPIEITSDQLDLSRAAGTALFTGNVIAIQGEMRLNAQWVLVEYAVLPDGTVGSEIQKITAKDKVLLVTPTEAAEGDNGVYWPQTRQVVMTGNVLLTQGPNTVAGDKMTADLGTGIGKVEGRVRSVLSQQPRQPQPAGQ